LAHEGPIKLSEAPARLFADDWTELVLLKEGEASALAALDSRNGGFLDFYRRQSIESNSGTVTSRRAEDDEKADALVDRLQADFRSLGAKGHIIAVGLYLGTGQPQRIPSKLWADAKMELDFGANTAAANGFVYHYVTVELVEAPVETVVVAIRVWLERRRTERGDELKKILRDAAREEFDGAFTVRAFNLAYGACYGRARGRPEKTRQ
jgi:hypothetical protein